MTNDGDNNEEKTSPEEEQDAVEDSSEEQLDADSDVEETDSEDEDLEESSDAEAEASDEDEEEDAEETSDDEDEEPEASDEEDDETEASDVEEGEDEEEDAEDDEAESSEDEDEEDEASDEEDDEDVEETSDDEDDEEDEEPEASDEDEDTEEVSEDEDEDDEDDEDGTDGSVVSTGDGDVVPPAAADASDPEGMKGIAAFFDVPDELLLAAAHTRDSEYEAFDAFSPFPIHGMDEALGAGRSWMPWVTFGAGSAGFLTACALQFGTMTFDWPMIIGGKPFAPVPTFVPIMFELTVLFAGVTTAVVMLIAAGCFRKPLIIDREITSDRFALFISAEDDAFDPDEVHEFLDSLDPVEIRTITKSDQ